MSRRREFDVAALDYRLERHPGGGHRVEAHLGGQLAGYLAWNGNHGMVEMVKTEHEHRGKGIATALWGAAHVMAARHGLVPPRHSDVKFPDGRHWANTMTVNSGPGKKQPRRPKNGPVEGQEVLF